MDGAKDLKAEIPSEKSPAISRMRAGEEPTHTTIGFVGEI